MFRLFILRHCSVSLEDNVCSTSSPSSNRVQGCCNLSLIADFCNKERNQSRDEGAGTAHSAGILVQNVGLQWPQRHQHRTDTYRRVQNHWRKERPTRAPTMPATV